MIRRPPRTTQSRSSAASDVYKRQALLLEAQPLLLERLRLGTELVGARGEILVRDVELLNARGQFLVEGFEFLVGRLELLIDGFYFLASSLCVLAGEEHRFVPRPKLGNQRGQLLIRSKEPAVRDDRFLESLPCPDVGATLVLESGHVRQLDDDAFDGTCLDTV